MARGSRGHGRRVFVAPRLGLEAQGAMSLPETNGKDYLKVFEGEEGREKWCKALCKHIKPWPAGQKRYEALRVRKPRARM